MFERQFSQIVGFMLNIFMVFRFPGCRKLTGRRDPMIMVKRNIPSSLVYMKTSILL